MAGEVDNNLEQIRDTIKARKQVLADLRATNMVIGTRVEFANVRPKYLVGMTGEVVSLNGRKVSVKLDEEHIYAANRYAIDGVLLAKPEILEIIA